MFLNLPCRKERKFRFCLYLLDCPTYSYDYNIRPDFWKKNMLRENLQGSFVTRKCCFFLFVFCCFFVCFCLFFLGGRVQFYAFSQPYFSHIGVLSHLKILHVVDDVVTTLMWNFWYVYNYAYKTIHRLI
jgi:hypothetical protein